MKKNEDIVQPIRITDGDKGITYELDFNREAVRHAQNRGFKIAEMGDFPTILVSDLFFYSFRKNHKNVGRNQTDALLEKMGGVTPPVLERLVQLYQQAATSNIIALEDDETAKNANVIVEM